MTELQYKDSIQEAKAGTGYKRKKRNTETFSRRIEMVSGKSMQTWS